MAEMKHVYVGALVGDKVQIIVPPNEKAFAEKTVLDHTWQSFWSFEVLLRTAE